jgi:hypothetical protein
MIELGYTNSYANNFLTVGYDNVVWAGWLVVINRLGLDSKTQMSHM